MNLSPGCEGTRHLRLTPPAVTSSLQYARAHNPPYFLSTPNLQPLQIAPSASFQDHDVKRSSKLFIPTLDSPAPNEGKNLPEMSETRPASLSVPLPLMTLYEDPCPSWDCNEAESPVGSSPEHEGKRYLLRPRKRRGLPRTVEDMVFSSFQPDAMIPSPPACKRPRPSSFVSLDKAGHELGSRTAVSVFPTRKGDDASCRSSSNESLWDLSISELPDQDPAENVVIDATTAASNAEHIHSRANLRGSRATVDDAPSAPQDEIISHPQAFRPLVVGVPNRSLIPRADHAEDEKDPPSSLKTFAPSRRSAFSSGTGARRRIGRPISSS